MADTPARSALAKLGLGSTTATSTVDLAQEYLRCTLRKRSTQAHSNGNRGTRGRLKQRVREVRREVSGQIECNPTATELDRLWAWMMGGTVGGTSPWTLGESLNSRLITVDKITKVYSYTGCICSKFTLTAQSGQPVQLLIDVEALTETEANAGTFPSINCPTDNMFVCSDLTLTLASTARKFGSISLTVDNLVDSDRYFNSLTREQIQAQDRDVSLAVGLPFTTDNNDLYAQAVTGAAGTLVMTDGTSTYTWAFTNVKIPAEGPEVGNKQEIMYPINCKVYGDGTDQEFTLTKS